MTLAAGTRLGPYEILSQIGAGGMGEVYRRHPFATCFDRNRTQPRASLRERGHLDGDVAVSR